MEGESSTFATKLVCVCLSRNALTRRKLKLATNMERVSSSVHCMTIHWCVSDSHLRDVGDETSCPLWNHAALRWATRDESLCEAYRDSVEQALTTSHIVNSDLPLDDWYSSVMGIIQQVASHHFGVKSTSPRRHWMTPTARQAQISKLVEYKRALSQLDDLGALFFECGTSLLAWGFWTGGFGSAAAMLRRDIQPIIVRNSRRP